MNYYPFDSRNCLYRNKFGSIAEGETLRLSLLLHKDACVFDAFLMIREDSESKFQELRLERGEWIDDYQFFNGQITLTEGLYWYSFRYTSAYGDFEVKRTGESLGSVTNEGECWQQTVYSADFSTPDWLNGGIIYQIFPDRFYNSGKIKENIPEDRYICDDWYAQPEFRQPKNKKRLCNDYYGGDLKGIEEKLPYLKGLGVSCIYLNPIFEAHSNHRYNTADYLKIDSHLGDEKDLESLVKSAKKHGIEIILDGVFSHTGDDSVYFNKYNRYDSVGAYNSTSSPYFSWFNFKEYPDKYAAWWGIESLPETNENDLSFSDFITGENGVIKHWLDFGVKGFRLDVADELPDGILDKIRIAVKRDDKDNYLLGEVWEDASNKISYGSRRRFLRGNQLDSVMNYPFANAIIDFVKGGNGANLINTVMSILENYPKPAIKVLMNHIGTHDTARVLTMLGCDYIPKTREEQAVYSLSFENRKKAINLLKLAVVLQYTLPGVPSIYYGDETGMEGFGDPFCRAAYPWGRENTEILGFYKKMGKIRRENSAFKTGEFIPVYYDNEIVCYFRKDDKNQVLVAVNCGNHEKEIVVPEIFGGLLKVKSKSFEIITK
ncbi:MAG: glycoside hydrolase family 13 protein [Clostridia bacterium]|nr:glycoside hydrolase family 13 protein [Clostridia bacterium]